MLKRYSEQHGQRQVPVSADIQMINPGSTSTDPDLDWSQIRETISMLCLTMAQVESTLTDSGRSVDELSHAFVHMANESSQIQAHCAQVNPDNFAEEVPKINTLAHNISGEMQRSIVAFQFYDRLSQKLSHVNESLRQLSDLIGDRTRLYDPNEWLLIQSRIRSNYTMECERMMFDQIMQGADLDDALELYRHQFEHAQRVTDATEEDDDIELF